MKNTRFFKNLGKITAGMFAILSLGITACSGDFFSQTIEIDPPPYTKQLSFHLDLDDQDSDAQILLTRNFGILETVPNYSDFFVEGGSAEIFQDGQKWLTLTPASPDSAFLLRGKLPGPLQTGSSYEIRVAHPDFPNTNATQIMPGNFTVDSVRIKRNAASGQFGDKFDFVDVFLNDQAGERNYYEVRLSSVFYNILYNPNTGELDTFGVTEYPLFPENFSDPNIVFGVNESGLVSDQFFDGQAYKFQLQVYAGAEKIRVRVRNVTEEFYLWSRSYRSKEDSEENPLVEPTSVFNNLIDGLGIFTVAREKLYEIE